MPKSRSEDAAVLAASVPAPPRRGPRSGDKDTRKQIRQAANEQFSEHGYQAATIRKIGEAASVDPSLIHYYFGTKEDLFGTAITQVFRSQGFADLLAHHRFEDDESPGTQYLFAMLTALEEPGMGPAFIGLVRNLGTHEESRRIFVRCVSEELLGLLSLQLQTERPETRVALAATQVAGLVLARYVLKVPPLVSLSITEVAHTIGPAIDRYIAGDLDWSAGAGPDLAY